MLRRRRGAAVTSLPRRVPCRFDRARYGNDDVDLEIDKLRCQSGQQLAIPRCRSVLDRDVPARDIAEYLEAFQEGLAFFRRRINEGGKDEIADPRDAGHSLSVSRRWRCGESENERENRQRGSPAQGSCRWGLAAGLGDR